MAAKGDSCGEGGRDPPASALPAAEEDEEEGEGEGEEEEETEEEEKEDEEEEEEEEADRCGPARAAAGERSLGGGPFGPGGGGPVGLEGVAAPAVGVPPPMKTLCPARPVPDTTTRSLPSAPPVPPPPPPLADASAPGNVTLKPPTLMATWSTADDVVAGPWPASSAAATAGEKDREGGRDRGAGGG